MRFFHVVRTTKEGSRRKPTYMIARVIDTYLDGTHILGLLHEEGTSKYDSLCKQRADELERKLQDEARGPNPPVPK